MTKLSKRLAYDLQNEFPDVGGFSTSNLWRVKGFCEAYTDFPKLAPLVREIGWSKNLIVTARSKDLVECEFYLAYCDLPKVQPLVAQIGWSNDLNIFQRAQAKFVVKDEYTFDFIEMGEDFNAMAASIKKNLEDIRV